MRQRSSNRLAKISRPRLHGPLPRIRLFAQIDSLRAHPAIWVSAPPGAGKTTLVASYLDARRTRSIWYQIDPGDADVSSFFHFLRQALGADKPRKQRLPLLTPEHSGDIGGFARRFFRIAFAGLARETLLVFDNWQDCRSNVVDSVLATAISQLPPGIGILVLSREDPGAEFARLRAHKVIAQMGWEDLRFNIEECLALLQSQRITDDETARSLHAATDGWPAGLSLLLESMRRTGRKPDFGAPDSREELFSYFASEVFDQADTSARDTLMKTAFLPRVSAAQAIAITADPVSGQHLREMFLRKLFVYQVNSAEPTYQYHALFRDFLLDRAERSFPAGERAEIICRAAELTQRSGNLQDAYWLYVDAMQWDRAGEIALKMAPVLLQQGRWRTLSEMIGGLPVDTLRDPQWFWYWQGRARAATDPTAARERFEAAYERFRLESDLRGQLTCCGAILDSYYQEWNTTRDMDPWIEEMERLLQRSAGASLAERGYALSAMVAALTYRRPNHPLLPVCAEETLASLSSTNDVNDKVRAAAYLFTLFSHVGDKARMREVALASEGAANSPDTSPMNRYCWWYEYGRAALMAADLDLASACFQKSLDIADENGLAARRTIAHCGFGMIAFAKGDIDQASSQIDSMLRSLDANRSIDVISALWLRLWLALLKPDWAEADSIWQTFAGLPAVGLPMDTGYNHPVIYYLVERGYADQALARVEKWRAALHGLRAPYLSFNLGLMEAYAQLRGGDEALGCVTLREALKLGRQHGFANTLAWVPPMMAHLFGVALRQGIETEYVLDVVGRRQLPPPNPDFPIWPRRLKVLTLGQFSILNNELPISFSRKAPKKLVAFAKALVALGEEGVPTSEIADILWPDLEGDAQQEALSVNLHRLRRLLNAPEAIRLVDGRLSFGRDTCWIDASAFERLSEAVSAALSRGNQDAASTLGLQALDLYRGTFLHHDAQEPWTVTRRERLRARFTRLVASLAAAKERAGDWRDAIEIYRRGIEIDTIAEEFHQGLIRCLIEEQRYAEAFAALQQLTRTLSLALGVKPSPKSLALADRLCRIGNQPDRP
jgi:LuxR family transcriptional regulator, maltose regulon positive regulatory protein